MDKKEYRRYKKMHKRHQKELIKLAKKSADFDFGYMHQYVVMKLKHMYEYYKAGDNVWQCQESLDCVLDTLKHALELADKIDNIWIYADNDTNWGQVECNAYKEFYTYIGEHCLYWWD